MSTFMAFKVVIPARYASTRLPASPCSILAASRWSCASPSVALVGCRRNLGGHRSPGSPGRGRGHGLRVLMTRPIIRRVPTAWPRWSRLRGWSDDTDHRQCAGRRAADRPGADRPDGAQLAESGADIATVAHPIADAADFFNPNVVKVVPRPVATRSIFRARRFPMRATILPARRRRNLPTAFPAYRHVGLYAYRAQLPEGLRGLAPAPLEDSRRSSSCAPCGTAYRISVAISIGCRRRASIRPKMRSANAGMVRGKLSANCLTVGCNLRVSFSVFRKGTAVTESSV
jgi:3-deoxy-manno-octulosonate cytidylyltransferase (CMP-KDO synthetase)